MSNIDFPKSYTPENTQGFDADVSTGAESPVYWYKDGRKLKKISWEEMPVVDFPKSYTPGIPRGFDADVSTGAEITLHEGADGDIKNVSWEMPVTVSAGYSFGLPSGQALWRPRDSTPVALEFGTTFRPAMFLSVTPLTSGEGSLSAGLRLGGATHGHGLVMNSTGHTVEGGQPMDVDFAWFAGARLIDPVSERGTVNKTDPSYMTGIEMAAILYADDGSFGPVLRWETSFGHDRYFKIFLGVKGFLGRD